MVELVRRAQVLKLLSELDLSNNELTSKEFEMYSQIKSKYSSLDEDTFDDEVCLEVMLRNITIRKSYKYEQK